MYRALVLLLFVASGASGLVYEVVWMRILSLTMSVTVYAVTTVLCAYMAGLALGAWLAGRVADRIERPLAVFGLAEVGIGILGILAPTVLFGLGPVEVWLHELLGQRGPALTLARFLLASGVLLVPCTLMGTTLPLLSRALIDDQEAVGRGAGALYGANALGAVVGCVLAGFLLIPTLGLAATSAVAAALNLTLGLTAVAVGRGLRRPAAPVEAAGRPSTPATVWGVAIAFGISGFSALGYEVLWTRALEQFTHNSTYAYTIMLATFLLGIGGGSALAARFVDRTRRPLVGFAVLQVAVAASVCAGLLLYMRFLEWVPAAVAAIGGLESWGRAMLVICGLAGSTLLATTLLFGATFPFVARSVVDAVDRVGHRVALAYSVNTVGSILGAIVVGFGLLPWLGMRGAFVALIAGNAALGAGVLLAHAPRRQGRLLAALAGLGALLAVVLLPADLFRDVYARRYGQLLMYREQVTDTVMVTQDETGGRLIRYGDGRGTAGTVTWLEDRSYAHIALLPHPDPKRILNICFGVGNSLSSVTQYPVEHVDQVELSPGVVDAAPFFADSNRNVLLDPRVNLHIDDGRNFLLTSPERYDVIRLDPPELHTRGIVNLYTREFFEMARDHLAPGGIFSIWVNISYTPEEQVRMIARTADAVFPYVSIWQSPYLYSWVINGSVEPRPPDGALLTKWFGDHKVRSDLWTIGIRTIFQFLSMFVMAGDEVTAWAGDGPLVTDDHTHIDFSVPRSRHSLFGISNHITDNFLAKPELVEEQNERGRYYCRYKRPVYPHLVNAGASELGTELIKTRINQALGHFPSENCVGWRPSG